MQFNNNGSKARVTRSDTRWSVSVYGRTHVRGLNCPTGASAALCNNFAGNDSDTGLAAAFGGGLDVRVGGRVIQVDYNPVHLNGRTLDNVGLGGGITFYFNSLDLFSRNSLFPR